MQAATPTQTTDSPTMNVLHAVAQQTGVDVSELERPLYEAIDPDALDRLLAHGGDVTVTFEYDDHTVVVHGDGTVTVDGDASGGDRR